MTESDTGSRSVKSHTIQVSPINDIRVAGDTSRACPDNTADPRVLWSKPAAKKEPPTAVDVY